jgi:orotate phosphoribosyltransferase
MSSDNVVPFNWAAIDQRNEEGFVQELLDVGVILRGHFVLRSGLCGDTFVDIKGLYPHTRTCKRFARAIGNRIQRELGDMVHQVRGVIGPARGGVMLAHDVADWTAQCEPEHDREVLAFFAEKDGQSKFYFGRGYDKFIPGGLFVVVEDVTTTGSAVKELVQLIHQHGGTVLLICAIWNRGDIKAEDVGGIPVVSLINRNLPTWAGYPKSVPPKDCPQCKTGVPFDLDHGRGREWVDEHGQPIAV